MKWRRNIYKNGLQFLYFIFTFAIWLIWDMDNRWVQFSYFSHAHIQLFWIKAAKLENQSLSNVAVNKNKGCAHDSKHYTQKILILDILQIPCYLIFQEQLSASFRFIGLWHGTAWSSNVQRLD